MEFDYRKYPLLVRLGGIIVSSIALGLVISSNEHNFTKLLIASLIVIQIHYLLQYIQQANKAADEFLQSLNPERSESKEEDEPQKIDYEHMIRQFREAQNEKDAEYHYLKTIVQHVNIGILTFDNQGEIQIINTAAKRLLNVTRVKKLDELKTHNPEFVDKLITLRTGGKELVRYKKEEDEYSLALNAIQLTLRGKEFKLVSLQNIQSELEEQEMEAWQNLIRVLTHEIMNSVTPISSMAALVEGEIQTIKQNPDTLPDAETISDIHLALKTIRTRSESLIKFVSDFRNMTKVRHPMLTQSNIHDMMEHICQLLKHEITANQINVIKEIEPADLLITLDRDQIEQVIINLVKNAIQALGENDEMGKPEKIIKFKAWQNPDKTACIVIEDNGCGIDEEAQKKIFIPFYTTKKNGSGIGLSLSKQIMRHHQGTITMKSVMNMGTEFMLRFPQAEIKQNDIS